MAVFFFLLFVLVRARVWQVQVIEAGSKASGPLILFPYQQYNIFMTIGKDPSPVPDVEQTTEQVLIGQMPLLLDRDNEGAAQNTFGEVQPVRIHGQYGWFVIAYALSHEICIFFCFFCFDWTNCSSSSSL